MTQDAKVFAQHLKTRYNVPVFNVDERLSSVEAAQEIAAGRASGTHKRQIKGDLDKLAARIILQTWFNQQNR
jgi:putative Holliday junction resolvase